VLWWSTSVEVMFRVGLATVQLHCVDVFMVFTMGSVFCCCCCMLAVQWIPYEWCGVGVCQESGPTSELFVPVL